MMIIIFALQCSPGREHRIIPCDRLENELMSACQFLFWLNLTWINQEDSNWTGSVFLPLVVFTIAGKNLFTSSERYFVDRKSGQSALFPPSSTRRRSEKTLSRPPQVASSKNRSALLLLLFYLIAKKEREAFLICSNQTNTTHLFLVSWCVTRMSLLIVSVNVPSLISLGTNRSIRTSLSLGSVLDSVTRTCTIVNMNRAKTRKTSAF